MIFLWIFLIGIIMQVSCIRVLKHLHEEELESAKTILLMIVVVFGLMELAWLSIFIYELMKLVTV